FRIPRSVPAVVLPGGFGSTRKSDSCHGPPIGKAPRRVPVVGCATGVLASDDLPHDVPYGGFAGGVLVVDEGVPVRGGDLHALQAAPLVLGALNDFADDPHEPVLVDVNAVALAELPGGNL